MILAACENWFDALVASIIYEIALAAIAMKGSSNASYFESRR